MEDFVRLSLSISGGASIEMLVPADEFDSAAADVISLRYLIPAIHSLKNTRNGLPALPGDPPQHASLANDPGDDGN